jgi:two-component system chemotaxis response regulator CheY
MRVLIVDDSRVVRRHTQKMMQSLGWETVVADSGPAALERLRGEATFDLAMVDIHMPGMTGLECIRTVRRELDVPGMKLMMVSTGGSLGLIAEGLASGADEFLMKPLTRENVMAKLHLLALQRHA